MKKRWLSLLLAGVMTLAMAGCSTPGSGSSGDSESDASDGEKVFRYAINTEPTSLDPDLANAVDELGIQHGI